MEQKVSWMVWVEMVVQLAMVLWSVSSVLLSGKNAVQGHDYCIEEDLNFLKIVDKVLHMTNEEQSSVVVQCLP